MVLSRADNRRGYLSCTHHRCLQRKMFSIHCFQYMFLTWRLNMSVIAERRPDLQGNWILVNIAACLHCGTEEQPAACMSSTAGERKPCVEMQSGCCHCSSVHTHIMTCVLVKCSSTRCFRFIIILLLCWRLYNSHGFEVISFAFAMKRTFIFIEKIFYIHYIDFFMRIKTISPLSNLCKM